MHVPLEHGLQCRLDRGHQSGGGGDIRDALVRRAVRTHGLEPARQRPIRSQSPCER